METILLVILVIVTVTMIGAVLVQRSEGGALGIGGGGPGAMFSARGSANFLTRVTAGLAAVFMILSLVLAILGRGSDDRASVMDTAIPPAEQELDPLQSFDSEDYEPIPLEGLESDSQPPPTESEEQSGNNDGPTVPSPD